MSTAHEAPGGSAPPPGPAAARFCSVFPRLLIRSAGRVAAEFVKAAERFEEMTERVLGPIGLDDRGETDRRETAVGEPSDRLRQLPGGLRRHRYPHRHRRQFRGPLEVARDQPNEPRPDRVRRWRSWASSTPSRLNRTEIPHRSMSATLRAESSVALVVMLRETGRPSACPRAAARSWMNSIKPGSSSGSPPKKVIDSGDGPLGACSKRKSTDRAAGRLRHRAGDLADVAVVAPQVALLGDQHHEVRQRVPLRPKCVVDHRLGPPGLRRQLDGHRRGYRLCVDRHHAAERSLRSRIDALVSCPTAGAVGAPGLDLPLLEDEQLAHRVLPEAAPARLALREELAAIRQGAVRLAVEVVDHQEEQPGSRPADAPSTRPR